MELPRETGISEAGLPHEFREEAEPDPDGPGVPFCETCGLIAHHPLHNPSLREQAVHPPELITEKGV